VELFLVESKHSSAKAYHSFLENNENLSATAFLTDIFKHLNDLNKKLQGKSKLVPELFPEVRSLCKKTDLLDLNDELLHFRNLKALHENNMEVESSQFHNFLSCLRTKF
jgi:hypothetical protein